MMEIVSTLSAIDAIKQEYPMVLTYFSTRGCGVCHAMLPKVEEMLTQYPEIKAIQVKVDESPDIAAQYSLFTAPAILVFVDGKETIREARNISLLDLKSKIARYHEMIFH